MGMPATPLFRLGVAFVPGDLGQQPFLSHGRHVGFKEARRLGLLTVNLERHSCGGVGSDAIALETLAPSGDLVFLLFPGNFFPKP